MTVQGWLEILVTLGLVVLFAKPIGSYMAEVFEGRRVFFSPALRPVERSVYRLAGWMKRRSRNGSITRCR